MHRSPGNDRELIVIATHQRHTQPRGVRFAHDLRGEVQELLDALAAAIASGDATAVARLWETPALVIGEEGVIHVTGPDDVTRWFADAQVQVTARGLTSTHGDLIDLKRVGSRIVIATVRWPYLDASGHPVGAASADYTLRRDDAGQLKIRAVLLRGIESAPAAR
ncbi:MAG: hypothetical protein M3680_07785 [Myxococcota bacterium]|nr:hypothetical protein [Myxococcota bacterium]